ncbi:MAG: hypothetical protein JSV49_04665 [Thermoplasmata archaeon]|nr:MAG: hypothetical protein JSV49_04665 [Thermoplasmata archaeon]
MASNGGIFGLLLIMWGSEGDELFLVVLGIVACLIGLVGLILMFIGAREAMKPSPKPKYYPPYIPPGQFPPGQQPYCYYHYIRMPPPPPPD